MGAAIVPAGGSVTPTGGRANEASRVYGTDRFSRAGTGRAFFGRGFFGKAGLMTSPDVYWSWPQRHSREKMGAADNGASKCFWGGVPDGGLTGIAEDNFMVNVLR